MKPIRRVLSFWKCATRFRSGPLAKNAHLYAARRQLETAKRLGSGKDGTLLVAKRKIASVKVAIKAHRFEEPYFREKLAYDRL